MKWFRHDTDASRSEGLIKIEKEFGIWGYAAWFKLLERIAEKMDKTDRCYAEYSENEWARILHCKVKILRPFLERCENVLGTFVERSDNVIKIIIPNLLQKKDEYSKKSGHTPDTRRIFPSVYINIDKNTNKKKKELTNSIPYESIIAFLNEIAGTNFKPTSKANQELIRARWNEGYRESDFKRVIENRHKAWNGTDKQEYIRPETLFTGKHFESYLNAREPIPQKDKEKEKWDQEIKRQKQILLDRETNK